MLHLEQYRPYVDILLWGKDVVYVMRCSFIRFVNSKYELKKETTTREWFFDL